MHLKVPPLKRLALLIFIVVPAFAWMFIRPVRVVLPQIASGIVCINASVCVDDASKADAANALHSEAVGFVTQKVAAIEGSPRIIFCSTQTCADYFGLGTRSAVTVGTFGTVVGPRAWKPYYIRHELIHYEQFRRLGIVRVVRSPAWFIEGMAYGLSEDPRKPLREPFESYRNRFFAWYATIRIDQLWQRAADL